MRAGTKMRRWNRGEEEGGFERHKKLKEVSKGELMFANELDIKVLDGVRFWDKKVDRLEETAKGTKRTSVL